MLTCVLRLDISSSIILLEDEGTIHYNQWRIYVKAKEAVLGGPRTQGAPQVKKKGCGITITRLIKLLI